MLPLQSLGAWSQVLCGPIHSFLLVRYSCLLSVGILHALLCLKVYSWWTEMYSTSTYYSAILFSAWIKQFFSWRIEKVFVWRFGSSEFFQGELMEKVPFLLIDHGLHYTEEPCWHGQAARPAAPSAPTVSYFSLSKCWASLYILLDEFRYKNDQIANEVSWAKWNKKRSLKVFKWWSKFKVIWKRKNCLQNNYIVVYE